MTDESSDAFIGYHLRVLEERMARVEQGLTVLLRRSTEDDAQIHELTAQLEASTAALAGAVSANTPAKTGD